MVVVARPLRLAMLQPLLMWMHACICMHMHAAAGRVRQVLGVRLAAAPAART